MKALRLFLTSCFFLGGVHISGAQPNALLDINNIKAGINSAGDLFNHAGTGASQLMAPQNSANGIAYAIGNLWIGGVDNIGQLYIAGQTYRQSGTDFWPGPLDTITATISQQRSVYWNNTWKINRSTIDSFKLGLFNPIPQILYNWPAHGDAAYAENYYLAPFFDANQDGVYDPNNGDYPVIKGDQAIFFIYNDALINTAHSETGGLPLGVEIHGMAYAFNCAQDSALANTIFINYKIINRSQNAYSNSFVGHWLDLDMAGFSNDKTGSDSLLNSFYFYDAGPDAVGLTYLNYPMTNAMAGQNSYTAAGNPVEASDYYGYLQSIWKDSIPLTYGGNGYGGNQPVEHIYTGDPFAGTGWLDTTSGDKRAIGSYGNILLNPGGSIELYAAVTFARDYSGTVNNSVNILRQRTQDIRAMYANDSTVCGGSISALSEQNIGALKAVCYPNPSSGKVFLEIERQVHGSPLRISLVNQMGQEVREFKDVISDRVVLDGEDLAPGIYFYFIHDNFQNGARGKIIIR